MAKRKSYSNKKPASKKSSAKKSTSKKNAKPRVSLNPLREQLKVLVDQANMRAQIINDNGWVSRAVQEAQRTLKRQSSRVEDENLFRSDLRTRQQINREFARVQAFLGDYTSTIQGAENFNTDLSSLRGAFGSKWREKTGVNYDTSRIDESIASETFEMYRRITEAAGGWERAVGVFQGKESLIGFGSETLITNIYDMYVNGRKESDIFSLGLEMINTGLKTYAEMAAKQVADYDYGIVFDDEDAQARRNYYAWRRAYKQGRSKQAIYE